MFKNKKYVLTYLIILVLVLIVMGGINLASLTTQLSLKDTNGVTTSSFIAKHVAFIILSIVISGFLLFLLQFIDLKNYILIIYTVTFLLLVAVLAVGNEVNGAKRWLKVGFINVQPSELAKLSAIIITAFYINFVYSSISFANKKKKTISKNFIRHSYLVFWVFLGILILVVLLSKSLSSSIQIFVVALCLFWSFKLFNTPIIMFTVSVASTLGIIAIFRTSYRRSRLGGTEHAILSEKVISNGGLLGKGYGQGLGKNFYLPEIHTDYVFAGFSEEWGFLISILLIIVFLLLIILIFYIANTFATNIFDKAITLGVGYMIANQLILHLLINTNLIPSTGVTLPFFSYGGTSTLTTLLGISLVISVLLKRKEEVNNE